MIINIKRVAQFLFDNAEVIARELNKSSNYRSASVTLDVHKHEDEKPKVDISFGIYDEVAGHQYLKNNEIYLDSFRELCCRMNRESGVTVQPKPVEVRGKL